MLAAGCLEKGGGEGTMESLRKHGPLHHQIYEVRSRNTMNT